MDIKRNITRKELTNASILPTNPSKTPLVFLATLLNNNGSNLAESNSFPTIRLIVTPSVAPGGERWGDARAEETTSERRAVERVK